MRLTCFACVPENFTNSAYTVVDSLNVQSIPHLLQWYLHKNSIFSWWWDSGHNFHPSNFPTCLWWFSILSKTFAPKLQFLELPEYKYTISPNKTNLKKNKSNVIDVKYVPATKSIHFIVSSYNLTYNKIESQMFLQKGSLSLPAI